MTLLTTQHNKLGGVMGDYLMKEFEPALYTLMKQKGYDLVPYVNSFGDTPENGWPEYWDSPDMPVATQHCGIHFLLFLKLIC